MMAKVGAAPKREALEQFRSLAGNGCVLPGSSCGHGDGWGIAAFTDGGLTFFEKSGLSAVEDERFAVAEDSVESSPLDLFLCHLRKASVGDVNALNAHPFHRDGITFCHNGGIKESEKLPVYGLEPEGATDSERFFLNILGRLKSGEAASLREAAEQAIEYVHANHRYTSICFLITDGKKLLAWRDYRTELRPDEDAPENWEKYREYYSLYHSPSARAVSSERLPALAEDWRMIDNRTLIAL
jgi:predicted glutamine amidotransferase